MAGIRKRSSNWNVQIRRSGHPPLSKTFKFKADAIYWANKTEALLNRWVNLILLRKEKLRH
jgi:hypothetical protein